MHRRTAILAAAGVLAAPGVASADAHSFTLAQAHQAAVRSEAPGEHVTGACRWVSSRMADCPGMFHGTIADNTQSISYRFTFTVERDGGCPARRVGNGTGVESGHDVPNPQKWQGCDRGPLTVAQDAPTQVG